MSITRFNRDIVETHILTKLDATTLAYTAATSRTMRSLCTEEKLWKELCTSTWPSINDSNVHRIISTFPSSYHSFFSNSSTFHRPKPPSRQLKHNRSSKKYELISAVDIRYKDKLIFSNVQVTKDFCSAPLSIEIPSCNNATFEPNEVTYLLDLEKSMSMSWILIDPIQKRSINLSSTKPILVERRYTPDEVHLLYATILPEYAQVGSTDPTQCKILVICEGEEGNEMKIVRVKMEVQGVNGINLKGGDSLVILQDAIKSKRTKLGGSCEWDEFKYLEKKRENWERIERINEIFKLFCSLFKILIFVFTLYGVRHILKILHS